MTDVIDVIHVPADITQPMQIRQIDPAEDFDFLSYINETPVEIPMYHPEGCMLIADETSGFAANSRATLIRSVHNNVYRDSQVYGDALITGPHDGKVYTSYPSELEKLLFVIKVRFAQVRPEGKKLWITQLTPYTRWNDAYEAALKALETFPNAAEVRVIPEGHPW